ncbi:MAG TPA: alpha-hydroxy-acid oxidizing protein [Acidisarcina sp.]
MAWEFINAGAADETTVRWNKEAYQRIRLRPRVLVDVTKLDTRVTLFGQEHAFPLLLAPTSAQTLTHPEGELATARAAGASGTTMVLSSFRAKALKMLRQWQRAHCGFNSTRRRTTASPVIWSNAPRQAGIARFA